MTIQSAEEFTSSLFNAEGIPLTKRMMLTAIKSRDEQIRRETRDKEVETVKTVKMHSKSVLISDERHALEEAIYLKQARDAKE